MSRARRLPGADEKLHHFDFRNKANLGRSDPPGQLAGLTELRLLSREADRIGVATEFDKILSRATDRTVGEARKLRELQDSR